MRAFLLGVGSTFFGNATAVRDFRSQLRGTRAMWLWMVYLLLLIFASVASYSAIVASSRSSIADLQMSLTGFYHGVMVMLAATISLIAPGITAASITSEKQRRSLDLIFSGPVRPGYLLIGKLIGGFRYMSMLLILAVPIVAVCVVLGGATWKDVLGAFIILLSDGLVFLSIGLVMSSISPSTAASIVSSYVLTLGYLMLTASLGASGAVRYASSMMGGSVSNEGPWYSAMNPFFASATSPTVTTLFGVGVPNWVLGIAFAVVASSVLVLGAASAMSEFGSKETVKFRIATLIASALFTCFLTGPIASGAVSGALMAAMGAPSSAGTSAEMKTAVAIGLGVSVLLTGLFWPQLMTFQKQGERKNLYDGFVNYQRLFTTAPSGAWPYLCCLVMAMALGFALGVTVMAQSSMAAYYTTTSSAPGFAAPGPPSLLGGFSDVFESVSRIAFWCLGFLTFWWGIARMGSAVSNDLKTAKAWTVGWMVLLIAIPAPIFSIIAANTGSLDVWQFHMLYPLFQSDVGNGLWVFGVAYLVVGFVVAWFAEKRMLAQGEDRVSTGFAA